MDISGAKCQFLSGNKQRDSRYHDKLFPRSHLRMLFCVLLISFSPKSCDAFAPINRVQLKSAVVACLRLSPRGRCSNGPHGAMATWDVSRVTDMSRLFSSYRSFDADISTWDVSRVKDMSGMFLGASSYNGDLSRWDVKNVKDMSGMFGGATLFKRRLCGGAWVHSKAKQTRMFAGSGGSIARNVCSDAIKSISPNDPVSKEFLNHYRTEFSESPTGAIARNAVTRVGMKEVMLDQARTSELVQHFSNSLKVKGDATNQMMSGRCWLFAACNEIRLPMMEKYDLPANFELSQAYLFFWDKLEKANYFLNAVLKTANLPEDSREVQHLLAAPVQDGGQYTMFSNIVRKYGLVPKEAYPETFHTKKSKDMEQLITSKLREFAPNLRESVEVFFEDKHRQPSFEDLLKHTDLKRQEMIGVIYRILAVCMGEPPKDFVWRYTTKKDSKFVKNKRMTPREFAKDIMPFDITNRVSLVNDPRNEYFKTYTVEKLGNVIEGDQVLYLNVPMDTIRKYARAMIDDGKPVWFGCDFDNFYNQKAGVLDTRQYDYPSVFGTSPLQKDDKARRLRFRESAMTHAMLITGYDMNDDDTSIRAWRVENSHSEKAGNKGYIIMTDEWFDEFLYQIVVDEKSLPDDFQKTLLEAREGKVKPKVLPPWDPMGALACQSSKVEDDIF